MGASQRTPEEQRAREAHALAALGCFYLRQGFPEKSRPILIAARALGAKSEGVERNLAYALLLTGDPEAALTLLDRMVYPSDDPTAKAALDNLRARAELAVQKKAARSDGPRAAPEPSLQGQQLGSAARPTKGLPATG